MDKMSPLQPMEIEWIETPSADFLCDRCKVRPPATSEELMATYGALKARQPDRSFLFTLDDLGQALYTSMHAKMLHNLDEVEGFNLETLGPECFEDGEHTGVLSSKTELFIREANYLRGIQNTTLEDVLSKQISPYAESPDDFISANQNIASVLDRETYVLAVERPHGYQCLYAFPNGYFSCDLNPFETCVLARHLEERFGLVLVGIGASRLAFLSARALTAPETGQLLSFLRRLYAGTWRDQLDAPTQDCLARGGLLVLRYTE